MNWRRGFTRLWAAASAIWLVITGIAFSLPQSLSNVALWRDPGPGQSIKLSALEAHITAIANLHRFGLYGVGLPVLAFVLGTAVWWIQRGFRPRNL